MSPAATGARRRAREVAFRVAYQADVAGDDYRAAWDAARAQEEQLSADQLELIQDLVSRLGASTAEVDAELQSRAWCWTKPSRSRAPTEARIPGDS